MRKFRLKANATRWSVSFIKGVVYNEDSIGEYNNGRTVLEYVQEFPDDWVEVFEDEPTKRLHKDTDLGYYAGLAMVGFIDNYGTGWNDMIAEQSIILAKEIIKQLNEEMK